MSRLQILLLHDLATAEEDRFRRLLSQLSSQYRFVSYSEAIRRIVSGEVDGPYLAFSFDDGLYGCWAAAHILEEFEVRGMFFVCPEIIDANDSQQAEFCRQRLWIPPTRFLSWREIKQLKDRGHEFGSHTLSHVNISETQPDILSIELADSKRTIQHRLGSCDHFAWPYGRFVDFSQHAQRVVADLQYHSCASGVRGAHAAHDELWQHLPCIRRESIEVAWPARHIHYFLDRSGRQPLQPGSCWPAHFRSPSIAYGHQAA